MSRREGSRTSESRNSVDVVTGQQMHIYAGRMQPHECISSQYHTIRHESAVLLCGQVVKILSEPIDFRLFHSKAPLRKHAALRAGLPKSEADQNWMMNGILRLSEAQKQQLGLLACVAGLQNVRRVVVMIGD